MTDGFIRTWVSGLVAVFRQPGRRDSHRHLRAQTSTRWGRRFGAGETRPIRVSRCSAKAHPPGYLRMIPSVPDRNGTTHS
jgi:hypothetical protein